MTTIVEHKFNKYMRLHETQTPKGLFDTTSRKINIDLDNFTHKKIILNLAQDLAYCCYSIIESKSLEDIVKVFDWISDHTKSWKCIEQSIFDEGLPKFDENGYYRNRYRRIETFRFIIFHSYPDMMPVVNAIVPNSLVDQQVID